MSDESESGVSCPLEGFGDSCQGYSLSAPKSIALVDSCIAVRRWGLPIPVNEYSTKDVQSNPFLPSGS